MNLFYFRFFKNKTFPSSFFAFIFLFCFSQNTASAQIVPTVGETECFLAGNGGVFVDTGGTVANPVMGDNDASGDYLNCNCNTITTLCSPDGSAITLDFFDFTVFATFDFLSIYDGDNNMGTLLYDNSAGGINDGDNTLAELLASNGSTSFVGTTGCITIDFFSTGISSDPGWEANITVASGETHPGDNIVCGANLNCLAPTNIEVNNLTFSTADLTWMATGTAVSYNIEYGLAGFTPGTGTVVNTTNPSTTLTGLTENTEYDFYINADCGNGVSNNALVNSFTTTFNNPCVFTLELFDSFGDGWNGSILNVSVNGGVGTDYTIDDGFDATFQVLAGVNSSLVFTYTAGAFQGEVSYNVLDQNGNIVFSDGPNPATGIVLETVACPTCPSIENITITGLTSSSANYLWSSDSSGTYLVEYGLNGFTPGSGTTTLVNSSSVSLTGLSENTSYDFYITVLCDNGDTSSVVGPTNFLTFYENPCNFTIELFDSFGDGWNGSILNVSVDGGVGVDYTIDDGFDATFQIPASVNSSLVFTYTAGSFQGEVSYNVLDQNGNIVFSDGPNPATGVVLETVACPSCPGAENINITNLTFSTADISWTADSSGTYFVEYGLGDFTPGSGTSSTITDPSIALTGLNQNTSYDAYITVYCDNGDTSAVVGPINFVTTFENPCDYSIELFDSFGDGWNGSILTVTVGCNSTDYTIETGSDAQFTINTGQNIPITFEYTAGAFQGEVTYNILDPNGNIIFMDGPNPQVGVVLDTFSCPTCFGPTDVMVDEVFGLSANVSWTGSSDATSYNIEYGPSNFIPGNGTTFSTTDNFASITGLDENTFYDFYVTGSCANGDESGLGCPETFQTIPLNDVGIVAINSPSNGCGLTETHTISVSLQNFGANPQSLIPFFFSVNGQPAAINVPLDGYFTNVIGQDSVVVLSFETTANLSGSGTFEIVAWTEMEDDSDRSNDTTIFIFETYKLLPLREDFEEVTLPDGWTSNGTIGDGHNNISNVIFRNVFTETTNLEVTTSDIGLVESGDMLSFDYRYTDWSAGTVGADLSAGDMLEVQASTDCGTTYNTIFTIDQNNHTISADLATIDIDLSNYIGQSVRFRWLTTYVDGDYWLDIDNINIGNCRPLEFTPVVTDESFPGAGDGSVVLSHNNGTGPYTYNWDNGSFTQTINDLSTGTYIVDVVDSYGCVGQTEVIIGVGVNTEDLDKAPLIKLFPNPTMDIAILDMTFYKSVDVQIEIINTIGQVLNEVFIEKTSEQKVELDLSNFPDGMYFVRVKADNQMTVKKLMKSRP